MSDISPEMKKRGGDFVMALAGRVKELPQDQLDKMLRLATEFVPDALGQFTPATVDPQRRLIAMALMAGVGIAMQMQQPSALVLLALADLASVSVPDVFGDSDAAKKAAAQTNDN